MGHKQHPNLKMDMDGQRDTFSHIWELINSSHWCNQSWYIFVTNHDNHKWFFFSKKTSRRQQNKAINRWDSAMWHIEAGTKWWPFCRQHFKFIFLTESISSHVLIQFHFVPKGSVHNMSAMVQVMAWHQRGAKPLPEPMLIWMTHMWPDLCVLTSWTI